VKKLVIFGTSGVAKELRYFAETDGYEVVAYVLDRCYITECKFDGRPLIAYEELADHYKRDEIALLIMTGYSNMNDNRKDILERCRNDGWQTPSFIHSSVLNLSKSVGIGNIIFPSAELGLGMVLGDGNVINRHTIISHDAVAGNYNFFAGSNHICGCTKIGNNNFFGTNSTVIDNGVIGDYNLVSAGVCLNKKLENNQMVAPVSVRERTMSIKAMDLLLRRVKEKSVS